MSTKPTPSRRTAVTGAAWSIPAIAVASSAPALAASCVTVTVKCAVKNKKAKTVTIELAVEGADGGTITITSIAGGGVGASTWRLPATATISSGGAVQVITRSNNASGAYTATYTTSNPASSGTFVFTV